MRSQLDPNILRSCSVLSCRRVGTDADDGRCDPHVTRSFIDPQVLNEVTLSPRGSHFAVIDDLLSALRNATTLAELACHNHSIDRLVSLVKQVASTDLERVELILTTTL